MKIKHYRAADMRTALRQVRDAQGPDAVILSSRKVSGGVEVVAAVDYDGDESSYEGDAQEAAVEESAPAPAPKRAARTQEQERRPQQRAAADEGETAEEFPRENAGAMNEELRTLRRMLETQVATLAWNDLTRRSPVQTELLRELSVLGLSRDLSTELVSQMPQRLELAEAHRLALASLSRRIAVAADRWVDSGGIVALVGPTGVGKTTLMAKLAANWVLRHGPRDIALVSMDSVRIGAQEQVNTLGRLLGVPAYAADDTDELADLLGRIADRRLVLIDTAGLSPRDVQLIEELTKLKAAHRRLETCLVLSAAAQAGAIEEAVERFAAAQPASVVLTKLDEAASLGGAISTLIRCKLPLAYVSDGQRVPEDLSPARAHQLIARAVELSRKAGASADEDLLQRRFGSVAHALA
jgi:flagellar biosynthesis protein FlhF